MKNRDFIDPKIKSENYLIYTENEGEGFKVIGGYSYEDFLDIKRRGWFDLFDGFSPNIQRIHPAVIFYTDCIDGWDFILDKMNKGKWKYGTDN